MSTLLQGLNPAQKKAAESIYGPVLVLAGAGSGKTRVLTHRLAHLIDNGVPCYNILAVTFTNKAAGEMRERVRHLVGEAADDIWISTFHSTCLRMLRRDIEAIDYERNFNVYDKDDQKGVVRKIIQSKGLSLKDHNPAHYVQQIGTAKNRPWSDERIRDYLEEEYEPISAEIFTEYQRRLRLSHALDFNDLINLCIRVFEENPGVLWRRQKQFRYIMVDEYQDTNTSQYRLIQLLGSQHQNVMVVGDDDQSIYRFRGADVENIYRFQEDFPSVQVIRLEQNYRSFGNILAAANSLIENNTTRMEKKMWTDAIKGPLLRYIQEGNNWDEAAAIRREIENGIRQGYSYSDFAIIYRTNASSLAFEQDFMQQSVPHVLVGARKFYERKEIKDVLAYLRLLLNESDAESFARAISYPKRGVGAKTLQELQEYSLEKSEPILESTKEWCGKQKKKVAKTIASFIDTIARIRTVGEDGLEAEELVERLLNETGYWQALEAEKEKESKKSGGNSDAERKMSNVAALKNDISRYCEELSGASKQDLSWLKSFLDKASLASPTEEIPNKDQSAVTLLTAHLAKGLEFPVVFVVGMNEGSFPHFRSVDTIEDVEEERRLVYVALTRAQKRLILTRAKRQQIRDAKGMRWAPTKPSRFVSEIPQALFEASPVSTVSASSGRKKFWTPSDKSPKKTIVRRPPPNEISYTKKPESPSDFQTGLWVSHSKYGRGEIVGKSGHANNLKLRIRFDNFGTKNMIAR
ncbi:MAG: UvrD-helicase domain-containing protein [Myxococcota bacterium]|nr:UvrD-helicase domain-containing protein [Myxococcota bacterium]